MLLYKTYSINQKRAAKLPVFCRLFTADLEKFQKKERNAAAKCVMLFVREMFGENAMKLQNNPYTADEPERILANPAVGLSSRQVRHIAQQGYANLPVQAPFKTTGRIIWDNLFTFFNLIFVVLAICLVLVGSYKNTLFLGIVAANILIGIIQQLRSKRALEKLTVLSAPKVCVIRDGQTGKTSTAKSWCATIL